MNKPARSARRRVDEATIVDALRRGGSSRGAATLLGMRVQTFQARAAREGVPLRETLRQITEERVELARLPEEAPPVPSSTPPQTAVLEDGNTVRLSLVDYAILRAQATVWQEELNRANRVIARLLAELEKHGCK